MTITIIECVDINNHPNDSIVPEYIGLKNYEYIPIYIHRIIQICIISGILSSDICILLFQELYKLYQLTLISYQPPTTLTMSHLQCVYCDTMPGNMIHSKIIDLHYGWNHCNRCGDVINKWYYHYIELNYILPFDYIDNIDIDINYYRIRTNTINSANINIYKKYIIYNRTAQNILVPIYWVENAQHYEKWIPLINILYHTNTIKTIKYRIPEYWSIHTIKCWELFFYNIYQTVNSLYKLNKKDRIQYFK